MLVWLLIGFLFVAFGVLGYFKGAIRMTLNLLGFFLALALAMPLAPAAKPLIPLMKVEGPIWSVALPPIIAFVVVELVFVILGFIVHFLVMRRINLQADDYTRNQFEALNRRLGLCLGAVAACFHVVLLALIAYVTGHLLVQVTPADGGSGLLGTLAKARRDLRDTGLEKLVARFDPAPPKYYAISDIIGLIYNNPALVGRLSSYPAYLSFEERQEFKDIGADTDYLQLIQTKGDFQTFLDHAKTQGLLANTELLDAVLAVDLKDLRNYLETGKSPKYDDERIIGRWRVDPNAILRQAKHAKQDISAQELSTVKKLATGFLASITMTATPENKIFVKAPAIPEEKKPEGEEAAAAAAAQAQQTQSDQIMTQRYGVRPGAGSRSPTALPSAIRQRLGVPSQAPAPRGSPQPGVAVAASAPKPTPPKITAKDVRLAGNGSWKSDGDNYELVVTDEKGKAITVGARFENDRLLVARGPITLVFEKVR